MKTVEIFSAGCPCCDETVQAIKAIATANDSIVVRNMKDPTVAAEAKKRGIARVPAVVVDGKLAECCATGPVDLDELRRMGVGAA